jgi:riboflavin synthase alpha subunit
VFTGIVVATGEIVELCEAARDRELRIRCPRVAAELAVGDSVAVDGVCLSVIERDADCFRLHAIEETLRVTTLGELRRGQRVNLEPALRAGAPLGGHFVQGHVDATGEIAAKEARGESLLLTFRAPASIVQQLVPKGSIAIDGISLTLAPELGAERFGVYLIPHTQHETTLAGKAVGARVNLETDLLGKYLWRYLGKDATSIDLARLRAAGFANEE